MDEHRAAAERPIVDVTPGLLPALAEALARYEASLDVRTPRTRANYRSALQRFVAYLRESGRDPAALTTADLDAAVLEDYYTWQLRTLRQASVAGRAVLAAPAAQDRRHRRSAATYAIGVRAFLRFLDRHGWLAPGVSYARIAEGARGVIGHLPYPPPQVHDEVAQVIMYVNDVPLPPRGPAHRTARLTLLRDRAILTTLYATALRRAELAALNRADVAEGTAREALVTGKGEKTRTVFLDDAARAAIRAYLTERADTYVPLFIRHDKGRGTAGPGGERFRLDPQSVWTTVVHSGELAGVRLTTHHLRHLRARVLLNAGMPLEAIQDVLGHASPETTKRIYAQFTQDRLRALMAQYAVTADEVAARSHSLDAPPAPGDC